MAESIILNRDNLNNFISKATLLKVKDLKT